MNEQRDAVDSNSPVEKKTPRRRDSIQISFRVNEHDYEKLKESADNLSMSVTAFAKMKVQNARILKPKFDKESSLQIIKELNAIGNNVNQIARYCNMRQSNRLSGATLEGMIEKNLKEVQRELETLWQQLN
ncbi:MULTISPECIES: MobC family plasmid mobilization relaxosome protein [unclassified Bacillus cereus group]|uniref:MobC family plasmid mobilization relaxosome protein n=1 Tax=unclassified Bacillus cereus group TaxID=2750818 RepID=UPI0011EDA023|nr:MULTISPECIES: MobC family plasmid mobilization relaxosome protein [unclassified Bacillus cereus group]QEL71871.1 plasmid mobilization relaxosome protein MobC [Bacillus sp. AR4-2]QEL77149.1 plasmid mobilization relaxosome protein MobC [Bacillus sp. SH8-8]